MNVRNDHMMHLEDSVLYRGVNGTRETINMLREMRDMLLGKGKSNISVKWDGSPSIICGTDPFDNKFFVATKSIFNKTPILYKSKLDIDKHLSGDLAIKMKDVFRYVSKLGIKGVLQGDLLYSISDVKKQKINDQYFITFHPNTIVYAIPEKSDLAKKILKSKIGIIWHTSYEGDDLSNMRAKYKVDLSQLRKSEHVWYQNAELNDVSEVSMTELESKKVSQHISNAGKLFRQISGSTLRELEKNPDLVKHIETFNNKFVRKGETIKNTKKHVDSIITFIKEKYEDESEKKKTLAGKTAQYKKRDDLLKFFSKQNKANLVKVFDLQKELVEAKLILIRKFNELKTVKTFVQTKDGYKVSGEEGYVVISQMSQNVVKVVDRLEFSYNNFSKDIVKGWESANRN